MDRAVAAGEERKRLAGERVERRLLDFDKVRPDLAPRGAVDAQPRDRAIPVPQKRILGGEAIEAAAFALVVFYESAASFLLPVFLRAARLRGQRGKAPVRGERQVDIMAIGIEEIRAHDGRLEIVAAYDRRDATKVAEGALVQPEKRLELLIPDRFLVAVPRMAQRHPKHPGPSPLAGRGVERGRPAEEIYLRLGPGRTVKDADGSPRRRQRPHKPFHRFVARAVPVFLDEVLPDPLQAQTDVEFLDNGRPIDRRGEPRARGRAGERFGRF